MASVSAHRGSPWSSHFSDKQESVTHARTHTHTHTHTVHVYALQTASTLIIFMFSAQAADRKHVCVCAHPSTSDYHE